MNSLEAQGCVITGSLFCVFVLFVFAVIEVMKAVALWIFLQAT